MPTSKQDIRSGKEGNTDSSNQPNIFHTKIGEYAKVEVKTLGWKSDMYKTHVKPVITVIKNAHNTVAMPSNTFVSPSLQHTLETLAKSAFHLANPGCRLSLNVLVIVLLQLANEW